MIQSFVKLYFQDSSYSVDCSHSGHNTLAYLDRKRPDLILLDYEMPGMNGEKVMQLVRSNPANGHIPIIFLTGMNDKKGRDEAARTPSGRLSVKIITQRKALGFTSELLCDSVIKQFGRQRQRGRG